MSDLPSPDGDSDLHPRDRADRPENGPAGPPPGGSLVVGVDGSAASRAALDWAVRHAASTRGRVLAVAAWREPVQTSPIGARGRDARRDETQRMLDDAVHAVAPGTAQVDRAVERGHADEVLVARSAQAGLLVLGSHRRGRVPGIGSVLQGCLRHAGCPVVAVPG